MALDEISPFRVGEVNIGPKFNNLSHCFLLRAGEEGTKSGNEHCLDRKKTTQQRFIVNTLVLT